MSDANEARQAGPLKRLVVYEKLLRRVLMTQKEFYGDGMRLHLHMIDLAKDIEKVLSGKPR
jgi:hypothetical protein